MVVAAQFVGKEFGYSEDSEFGFSEGLAVVELNGKSGYIDKTGKLVIAAKYNYGFDFIGGLARVFADGGKVYHIDKTGKIILELKE